MYFLCIYFTVLKPMFDPDLLGNRDHLFRCPETCAAARARTWQRSGVSVRTRSKQSLVGLKRMEMWKKGTHSSVSDQFILLSEALSSESATLAHLSFFLSFICVPSSWSGSGHARSYVLTATTVSSFSDVCCIKYSYFSLTQRLQSAALMFQTSRIKLIGEILVSWKDRRSSAVSPI